MSRLPSRLHAEVAASGNKRRSDIGINDVSLSDQMMVIRLCFTVSLDDDRLRSSIERKGEERERNRACRIGAANQQRRTKWICKRTSGFSLDDPGFILGMIRFSF